MHRLFVLDENDWTILRRGGTLQLQIGNETYGLITETSFGRLSPDVSDNGPPPPAPTLPGGTPTKRRYTHKRYTLAQKHRIVADLDKAKKRGETVKALLTRHGISTNSAAPYVWRRQFAAQKRKGGSHG